MSKPACLIPMPPHGDDADGLIIGWRWPARPGVEFQRGTVPGNGPGLPEPLWREQADELQRIVWRAATRRRHARPMQDGAAGRMAEETGRSLSTLTWSVGCRPRPQAQGLRRPTGLRWPKRCGSVSRR